MKTFLVFLGGGAGSIARFYAGRIIPVSVAAIPWPTLTVNVMSSFVLGIVAAFTLNKNGSENIWLLLAVGFCGGFSTFSSFSYELLQMLKAGMNMNAFIYIVSSVILTLIAVWSGYSLMTK